MVLKRSDWIPIVAWAQDFVREVNDRPSWTQWLFKLIVGRLAYREFVGLIAALEKANFDSQFV